MQRLLDERKIWFNGSRLPTSLKPHLVPPEQHADCERMLKRLCSLFETLGKELLEDKDLFDLLNLPPGSRELIEIDPGYDRLAVICRPDMSWSRGMLSLYEINTDSPAMLVFSDAVQEIQRELFPFADIAERFQLERSRRGEQLLDAIVGAYREWGGTKESPTIAIVDWANQKTEYEQEYTARLFTSMGYPSLTCTPHDLYVEGHRLMARGEQIDIVQRRVLFPDFLRRREELEPLLHAYREHLACVVNPLRSYVVGNKALLAVLSDMRRDFLGSELRAVLPQTGFLNEKHRAMLAADRERYVMKPCFGFGSANVVVGATVDDETWSYELGKSESLPYVFQEYRNPFTYRLPQLGDDGEWNLEEFYGNWNPVIVGGEYAGGITRVSQNTLVSITARGALLPSIPT